MMPNLLNQINQSVIDAVMDGTEEEVVVAVDFKSRRLDSTGHILANSGII